MRRKRGMAGSVGLSGNLARVRQVHEAILCFKRKRAGHAVWSCRVCERFPAIALFRRGAAVLFRLSPACRYQPRMPDDRPLHSDPLPGAGRALALLLTINLFNYIDRQVLAAVEPVLSAEFKLTEPQAGSLASAFLYAYMIGAPILGRLPGRWWGLGPLRHHR